MKNANRKDGNIMLPYEKVLNYHINSKIAKNELNEIDFLNKRKSNRRISSKIIYFYATNI
mgnify:CR=1 FL=1